MSLTAKEITEIARLLDASGYGELKLQMGDFRLSIRRDGRRGQAPAEVEPEAGFAAAEPAPAAPAPAAQAGAGEVDVPAPLLGNFYHAPRPGEAPFVVPGQRVEPGTTIGIIEVMKLMNPVSAGIAGTVVALLADNASVVEEGQPLLRVRVD